MFSCMGSCMSRDNYMCSCGTDCSNLDILYYITTMQEVGLLYSASLPVTQRDTICVDSEHDSCLQLFRQQ